MSAEDFGARSNLSERVCCVMRSVGERTAQSCRTLLGDQVGGIEHVVTVGSKPFPETLADSLRAGLAAGKAWTLCLDADVLPFPGAVAALVAEADRLERSIFEVQPVVFDRFFGGWRPAGVHLYRTDHLSRALSVLEAMESSIRPEAALLNQMATEGLAWKQSALQFGLHDFEQASRDIYRKCFVHARKHADLRPALERYWLSRQATAPDFVVALAGLAAGGAHAGPIELDARAPYLISDGAGELVTEGVLDSIDPAAMLEAEERMLATLPNGVAPVWDWLDSVWAEDNQSRRTIDALMRAMLAAGAGPCLVDGIDTRTRILLRSATDWGVTVSGVVGDAGAGRRFFRAVPVVSESAADDPGTIRIRRTEDGRFTLRLNGRHLMEPPAATPRKTSKRIREEVIGGLVHRLSRAGVERVLVYGAGELGAELVAAMGRDCTVVAFVESEPSRLRTAPGAAPVLDPEGALEVNKDIDVVIASLGSAPAMVRRLLTAAAATNSWPRQIWLMET